MNKINKKAFTLIELLVVVAVIGILTTLAVVSLQNTRKSARDAKRVADIKQLQLALELYVYDNGFYPPNINFGGSLSTRSIVYMEQIPQAPVPPDGDCDSITNEYLYIPVGDDNYSYEISFCLGNQIGDISSGEKCATPDGILSNSCSGSIVPTGFTKLHDFNDTNGKYPEGSLIVYEGVFYGMTQYGGSSDMGIIFKVNPDGTGFVKLHEFTGADGKYPYGNLIVYNNTFYGMAEDGGVNDYGTIFKINPNGTGFTKLHDFDGTNGRLPYGNLLVYNNALYGMAGIGGDNNLGTIFKINPDGSNFTKLYDFNDTNGKYPSESLIIYGNVLYGMTIYGGAYNFGTIFSFGL